MEQSKIIIIALISVLIVVGVALAYTVNQNTIEVTQESTQTQETQSQQNQSKPSQPIQIAAQLSDDKREFIPSKPKDSSYFSRYTAEEIALKEEALMEIMGDEYLSPYDRFVAPMVAPMYLDQAENPTGKAAIIDMLWEKIPNRDFIQRSNDLLAQSGYEVDIYLTKDATIDVYKQLPSMNYDYIVWRTHGLAQGAIEKSSTIYTGEVWESGKYYNEQLAGQIKFGYPYTPGEVAEIGWENLTDETYYTIGHAFVDDAMQGEFNDSVILIGGCDALSGNILANSFIKKGASIVIGWTDIIGANENDDAILLVLEELLLDKTIPEYAAKNASDKLSKHPLFKDSRLAFVSKNI